MTNNLQTQTAKPDIPYQKSDHLELRNVLLLLNRACSAECQMLAKATERGTTAVSPEMRVVGHHLIECEKALSTLCDKLGGTDPTYLAVDMLYSLLPRYRLTRNCVLKTSRRLEKLAKGIQDQPELTVLVYAAASLANEFYAQLRLCDDLPFPPLRSTHLQYQ